MAVQKLEHVYMRKGRGQWRRMTRGRGRGSEGVRAAGRTCFPGEREGREGACGSRKFLREPRRPVCLRVTHLLGDSGGPAICWGGAP